MKKSFALPSISGAWVTKKRSEVPKRGLRVVPTLTPERKKLFEGIESSPHFSEEAVFSVLSTARKKYKGA